MNPESPPGPQRLLNADEVADLARITQRHLWRLVARGEFPQGLTLGRRRLWHPDELEEYWRKASRREDRKKVLAKKIGIESLRLPTPTPEPRS